MATTISNTHDLAHRIDQLRAEKALQKEELHQAFKSLESTLSPANLIKSTVKRLVADDNLKMDVTKLGMNIGANFVFQQLLGRHAGMKALLSMLMASKVPGGIIRGLMMRAATGIKNAFDKKSDQAKLDNEWDNSGIRNVWENKSNQVKLDSEWDSSQYTIAKIVDVPDTTHTPAQSTDPRNIEMGMITTLLFYVPTFIQ